jgi:hypothetical protein
VKPLADPRQAETFRFVRARYEGGEAQLVYAFDDGPELIERIDFPQAPALAPERTSAFSAALRLLHLIAGVSYYKAGVPPRIVCDEGPLDSATADLVEAVYGHGLAEFAYQNRIALRERIRFPRAASIPPAAAWLPLPRHTLVPLGGGKDSLVTVEWLRALGEPASVIWIGDSELIAACAARTGLAGRNLRRRLAPELFEYNRQGAYNGHIPVTAINSAILLCAAVLYGCDAIAFSNERSASVAMLEYAGQPVNHQWSKGIEFERCLREYIRSHITPALDYFSLLRPFSELAVARLFARSTRYDDVFSSCNRNFRIRGERPLDRWCGRCPKCHFVFLALAPFLPKPRLLAIFGRNLLDDPTLATSFDALLEYREHRPFECVGEGREARAAMAALSRRPEWREDALVARFAEEILPQLDPSPGYELETLLAPSAEHFVPPRLTRSFDAAR